MPGATIPPPHPDEIQVARTAIRNSFRRAGFTDAELDNDPRLCQVIGQEVAVNAQRMAEVRWLTNMTHDPVALSEFLALRDAQT